jgi:hypothetical protein
MPRIVPYRMKLSAAQLRLLDQIKRAEPLDKRDEIVLRSLEVRSFIKLRRPGHTRYPLDPAEYVITEKAPLAHAPA